MSDGKNRLTRFWFELKRRKVIHVVTVYASAAFVIIELINNLAEPLKITPRLTTGALIFLGVGFPIVVILSWLYDLTEKGVERTRPSGESEPSENVSVPNAWKISTYISFVIIGGLITLNLIERADYSNEKIRSLVVLPFENLTGDESLDYFVSGMHTELIGDMGQISGLRVISKTSSRIFQNTELTVPEIASELGVEALVEASVLRINQGIRISVKLVNAVPEQQLWSQTFESPQEDFLSIYNEIIKKIAGQIQIALTSEETSYLENPVEVHPEAYKAYLNGVYHIESIFDKRGFLLALENFNKSLTLDSMYAPTYAGIAFAWIAALQGRMVTVAEAIPEIYSNNMKALSIDPDYPDAHYINALMSAQGEWDWKKSEAAFRKAIEGNPNHVLSHAHYSHILMWQRRFEEAFNELGTAMDLDPKNPMVLSLYAVVCMHHGDLDQALQLEQQLKELQPQRSGLSHVEGVIYYLKGDLKKSMIAFEDNFGSRIRDFEEVKNVFKTVGYKAAMKELAEQLQEWTHVQSLPIALFYNRAGMEDEAISWLERGYEVHDPDMPYAFLPAELQNLRSDPRYRALAEKMNLPIPETVRQ